MKKHFAIHAHVQVTVIANTEEEGRTALAKMADANSKVRMHFVKGDGDDEKGVVIEVTAQINVHPQMKFEWFGDF